jgi:hypothetical protein
VFHHRSPVLGNNGGLADVLAFEITLLYSSVKLSFTLLNAIRKGSPFPVSAVPKFIIFFVITDP